MIGLDTNILARYFAQDDPSQGRRASRLILSLTVESPGFVSLVSLIELAWVMRTQYHLTKTQLMECVERLLDSPELVVESQVAVAQALRRFAREKADLADCLIERCGHLAGCRNTVTFDVNASRFAGMKLL